MFVTETRQEVRRRAHCWTRRPVLVDLSLLYATTVSWRQEFTPHTSAGSHLATVEEAVERAWAGDYRIYVPVAGPPIFCYDGGCEYLMLLNMTASYDSARAEAGSAGPSRPVWP